MQRRTTNKKATVVLIHDRRERPERKQITLMKNQLASRAKNSGAASPAQPKTRAKAKARTPRKPSPADFIEHRQKNGSAETYEPIMRVLVVEPPSLPDLPPCGRWPLYFLGTATTTAFRGLGVKDAAGLLSLALVRHRAYFRERQGTLLAANRVREAAELLEAWLLADAVIQRLALPGQTEPGAQDAPFAVPLPGLAGMHRRGWGDAAMTLACALYDNTRAATAYLRSRVSCDRERAELAEALLVAEAVMAFEGRATALEGRGLGDPPTTAQTNARLEIARLGRHS